MADGQIEYIPWDKNMGHGLGRHIRHDPRSRNFAAPRKAEPTRDKRHHRYGSVLNQGQLGACTGFTGAHNLNSAPMRSIFTLLKSPTFKAEDAISFYSGATARDPFPGVYPPDDTGSSGLAVAQELQARGHVKLYEWAFGFQHGLGVISQRPLMQGSYWTYNMFYPTIDGQVRPTGGDAGGHEYLWMGVELRSKTTRSDNRSWFLNSWGAEWGLNGYFWMTWDDHEALLARDGDLVVLS